MLTPRVVLKWGMGWIFLQRVAQYAFAVAATAKETFSYDVQRIFMVLIYLTTVILTQTIITIVMYWTTLSPLCADVMCEEPLTSIFLPSIPSKELCWLPRRANDTKQCLLSVLYLSPSVFPTNTLKCAP